MTDAVVDLSRLSPRALLALYSQILTELIARRIVWSRNAPAGDYAELLVAEAFGGRLAKGSEKSWDVKVDNEYLQVKCRVIDSDSKRTQTFSPFRSFTFDKCVFVLLDSHSYRVTRAIQIDRDLVERRASLSAWVAGSRLTVRNVLAMTEGVDVTDAVQRAQDEVDARGRRAEHEG